MRHAALSSANHEARGIGRPAIEIAGVVDSNDVTAWTINTNEDRPLAVCERVTQRFSRRFEPDGVAADLGLCEEDDRHCGGAD